MSAMKALSWLESVLQDLAERPQWLLMPKRTHPLALAAAITRSLEAQVLPLGDRVVAPNEFSVHLHPGDIAQFAPVHRTLERELAMYVGRAAQERGLSLTGLPVVCIVGDDTVKQGTVDVEAAFVDASPPATTDDGPWPVAGFTERIEPSRPRAAPVAGNLPSLELLSASGQPVRTFVLESPIVTLGRRSGNDIPLLDLEVSRQHARIDYVPPRYYVSDLGSTNGTLLNGQPVRGRVALNDGDVIELGHQRLRFRRKASRLP